MIDSGLVVSLVVVAAASVALGRRWPPKTFGGKFADRLAPSAFVGVVVGRAIALLLDDPGSLVRLREFLVIRGGVEFWPGVAAGALMMMVGARRDHCSPVDRLADLMPHLLVLYGTWEATCPLRGGCFGPAAAIGLVPPGVGERQVPVGIVVAGVMFFAAWGLHTRVSSAVETVVYAVAVVSAVRFGAAFYLPHIGSGLTRPQIESGVVAANAAASASFGAVRMRRDRVQKFE